MRFECAKFEEVYEGEILVGGIYSVHIMEGDYRVLDTTSGEKFGPKENSYRFIGVDGTKDEIGYVVGAVESYLCRKFPDTKLIRRKLEEVFTEDEFCARIQGSVS